jgi:REP element-mobilizing transposase RayT
MPRQARLDVPDYLYHVFASANDQKQIFTCDDDYIDFIQRFKKIIKRNHVSCYAWTLLPNQFFLLIKPKEAVIKKTMRQLLTGYVSGFKHRHQTDGHIFHGRYHSIICQEKPYFNSLICDVHLQPIKNGFVQTINELSQYLWSGHKAMIGHKEYMIDEQGIDQAFKQFSNDVQIAQNKYINFLQITLNKNENFQGGGWMRSTGSTRKDIWSTTADEMIQYDPRILGDPEFVKGVLKKAETLKNKKPETYISIHELIEKVARYFDIPVDCLFQKNQQQTVSLARCVICYIEIHCLGRPGSVVGKMMKINPHSARRCAERGKNIYELNPELKAMIGI